MRILIVVLSDKMVHEERLATSRSFEQYSSPISMLLKARCGRFAFACTFVFPTKRFKFARIKSIDNEALLRQLVQSSQKKVPLFFTTDRLVQILDFGEVSTDRQVLSRVIRKVLSNSKHTLLCLCGHNVLGRINLIPLKTLRWFAPWLEAQSLQGTARFSLCPKDETNKSRRIGDIEYHSSG